MSEQEIENSSRNITRKSPEIDFSVCDYSFEVAFVLV